MSAPKFLGPAEIAGAAVLTPPEMAVTPVLAPPAWPRDGGDAFFSATSMVTIRSGSSSATAASRAGRAGGIGLEAGAGKAAVRRSRSGLPTHAGDRAAWPQLGADRSGAERGHSVSISWTNFAARWPTGPRGRSPCSSRLQALRRGARKPQTRQQVLQISGRARQSRRPGVEGLGRRHRSAGSRGWG